MGQLTTTTDHRSPSTRSTPSTSPTSADVTIDPPDGSHGGAIWNVARASGTLDLNSSYAYLLMARDFAQTSRVALCDGSVVGFVIGYLRPSAPERLFVWQIAVDETMRGHRIAARMLDSLLADLPEVRTVETTITDDNEASQALFRSLATRHGAEHTIRPLFEVADFPDEGHEAELLHVIDGL